MKQVTFITGNKFKAEYLSNYLDYPIDNQKIDLEEIQSLSLEEIVTKKVKNAYSKIQKPVLVEDVSLEFVALNGLPGPFIKFFVDNVPFETICSMINGQSREAFARCIFGYYDGEEVVLFEGGMKGIIAEEPDGDDGYGWDKIFIPEGYSVTRASLSEEDNKKTYLKIKPFAKVKEFLLSE